MSILETLPIRSPVWGIDPSTTFFAVTGILPGGSFEMDGIPIPQAGGDEAGRLMQAEEALTDRFTRFRDRTGPPAAATIEQPFAFGRNVHPQSYYIVSAGLIALRRALPEAIILTRGPGQWKLLAMGDGMGNAKKAFILAWARTLGLPDTCERCQLPSPPTDKKADCKKGGEAHDKADSMGLAVATALLLPA